MLAYWILFTWFALGAVDYRRRNFDSGKQRLFLGAAVVFTAAFIGFRYEVGGDWYAYVEAFELARYEDFASAVASSDPGYSIVNWLASRLGVGIWAVNLVCAAIFMWGLFRFARHQANPWLAVLVAVPYLIIVVAMGYTRQAVAIGIIMAGLVKLGERPSMVRFGLYVLSAALFHKTAIIVLPLVAFAAAQNKWVMVGIGGVMGAMLYYLLIAATIDQYLIVYEVADYDSQGALIRVVMNLPPAAIFLLLSKRFQLPEFEMKLWRNFSLAAFSALALLMLMQSSTVIDRVALYLIPLQLFVFSRIPSLFDPKGRQSGPWTLAIVAYSALVQAVWLTGANHAEFWLPYRLNLH